MFLYHLNMAPKRLRRCTSAPEGALARLCYLSNVAINMFQYLTASSPSDPRNDAPLSRNLTASSRVSWVAMILPLSRWVNLTDSSYRQNSQMSSDFSKEMVKIQKNIAVILKDLQSGYAAPFGAAAPSLSVTRSPRRHGK